MFVFLHKSITDFLPVAGMSRGEFSLCVREKQGFESQEPASNNLKFTWFIYDNMLATQGLVLIFFLMILIPLKVSRIIQITGR